MKMYFSISKIANCNSRFRDSKFTVLAKIMENRVFNPTVPLRYVFNSIRLLRYGFEHSRLQLTLLKTGYDFCIFQNAKSEIAIPQSRNRKTQFEDSDFKNAHFGNLCSKSILSDSIGIKTILSKLLGLKLRFWRRAFKNEGWRILYSKMRIKVGMFKIEGKYRHFQNYI